MERAPQSRLLTPVTKDPTLVEILDQTRSPASAVKPNRSWVPELDHMRTLAILAVLAIHTSSGMTQVVPLNAVALVNAVIFAFTQYAVPAFILISGFALALNHSGRLDLGAFYRHRARGIVPQFLIFSALYLAFYAVINDRRPTTGNVLHALVFGDAAFHLRFLPFLIQFYLLFPLLMAAYEAVERRGHAQMFVVASLILQLAWNALVYAFDSRVTSPNLVMAANEICLSSIFYFCLGIYASRNLTALRGQIASGWTRVLAAAIAVSLSGVVAVFYVFGIERYGYYYSIPPSFLTVPSLVQPFQIAAEFVLIAWLATVLARSQGRLTGWSRRLGDVAFGIYLVHVFFYTLLLKALPHLGLGFESAAWYPLMFIGMLGLSYVAIRVLSPLPMSDVVLGIRRRQNRA